MAIIGRMDRELLEAARNFTLEVFARGDLQGKIRKALERCGQLRQRASPLQPVLMTWMILGLPLFRSDSVPAVLARLLTGLRDRVKGLPLEPSGDDALAHARQRIGVEPIRALFHDVAASICPPASFHGYRTWAIDGVKLTMPDTPKNVAVFRRPKVSRGRAAFPRIKAVALQATALRRVRDVRFGLWDASERALAEPLFKHMGPGDLVHLDRGLYGAEFLSKVTRRQADFLVRIPARVKLKAVLGTRKQDGDYLAWIGTGDGRLLVRIIEYRLRGSGKVRLATSVIDSSIPVMDWVLEYHERWEIEIGFDEIETHLTSYAGGALKTICRSNTPRGGMQEAYALFCTYNLVRETICVAAAQAHIRPTEISFVGTLRAIGHMIPRMRSAQPERLPQLYRQLLADIADQCLERPRRKRRYPRVVKVKMSNFPLKRPHHHQLPSTLDTIRIGA